MATTIETEFSNLYDLISSLFGSLRKRSARYGRVPEITIPWTNGKSTKMNLADRCLQLNRFLLDNTLPGGGECCFKKPHFHDQFPQVPQGLSRTNTLEKNAKIVAKLVMDMRYNQYFEDGNHRTSILTLFELLADIGIRCHADVVDLYVVISNGGNEKPPFDKIEDRTDELARLIRRTARWAEVLDKERETNALNVKSLPKWNTLFEDLGVERSKTRYDTNRRHRVIKRRFPKRYHQYRRLLKERS